MENYLLVNNYGKSNTPDRIYYIMTRSDLPNLIKEESVVFGDKAYILEEGTMMFMGNDGIWYDTEGEVPVITAKELNVTQNGTYIDPDPYVAYRPVNVQVTDYNVEGLNVTENGTYSEPGKAYSPVIVNVPLPENAYLKKDLPTGAIATVTDAEAEIMPSLKVAITPVQSGSGDPSPDNIRPISGWTECNVWRTGKNLLGGDFLLENAKAYIPSGTVDTEEKSFRFSSNDSVVAGLGAFTGTLAYRFKPNTQYTIILTGLGSSTAGANFRINYDDGTNVSFGNFRTQKSTLVYVTEANKTLSSISKRVGGGTTKIYCNECGVFEGVLTAADFVQYEGTTYSITFPSEAGTVYGGTLDVVNGVLKADGALITLKGNEAWTKLESNNPYFILNLGRTKRYVDDIEANSYCCSHYTIELITTTNATIGSRMYYSTTANEQRLIFRPNGYSSLTTSQWKNYLANQYSNGTPVQFCAKLVTPVTYQLTPTEVQMLLGTNNLWADTGDILEGKYWSKNPVTVTRAMMNTLRSAGEITEITEPEELEEPEENDER